MNEKTRVCKTCGVEKIWSKFPLHAKYKDGIRPHCIECRRKKELEYHHTNKNKEGSSYKYDKRQDKNKKLQRSFGITVEEYEAMLKVQNYKCPICESSLPTDIYSNRMPPVDHCHNSGDIRGILCKSCNIGLGEFKDSVDSLKKAIVYLENNGVNSLVKAKEFIALG